MIGQCLDAAFAQRLGKLLGLAPRGAIDDAALRRVGADEIGDLLAAAGFGLHRQPQIRPVEAMHEYRRRPAEKLVEYVGARAGIGGGGERDGLHVAKLRLHCAKRCIFGAEVVAPL